MHRSASALAVLALFGLAPLAHAQERGYSIDHFDLSERGSEWFATDSLDLRGHARPALGIVGEWAFRPLVVYDENGDFVSAIVRNQFVLHPGASLVLWERLRLAIDLPIQAYADGFAVRIGDTRFDPPADTASMGDLRLGAALRLFGTYGDVITGALGVQVSLPTGSRESYAGDGDVRVAPHFMLAGDIAWFVYAAKLGVTLRTESQAFGTSHVGHYAYFAASAGVRLAQGKLVIGPEYFARSVLVHEQFFKKRATPMELMLGLHWLVGEAVRLGAGFGLGLDEAYGTPQRRGLLSMEWTPGVVRAEPPPAPADRDADGILDSDDACPDVAGLPNPERAKNGCPPPPDRDADGILDSDDACPDQAGIKTDDPNTNGCPPPPDRDADGILDRDDACPDVAGERSADPAKNGCPPPPDRDHDGILDADDACPNDPGNPDPDATRNGCPKAFVVGDEIRILDQVKFKTNSAQILPGQDSEDVLLAVLEVLHAHPEVMALLVEGHTDNKGSAKHNRKLSKERAQTVATWLVQHGIDAARLTAGGYGPDRPIDTNDTELGRKNNRRVEFHIQSGDSPAP
jgi:outer membrane protein OmpA-like peptidoglycan-associated protein